MSRFRFAFPILCLAVAGVVGVLALTSAGVGPSAPSPSGPHLGGPFHLVDQDGRAVDQHLIDGKWTAVFFGYTFCPEACPTTLQGLAAAQDRLGARGRDFQIVFVTVDPGRDTPAKMKAYLATPGFPKGVIGLTGGEADIARAAKAYRVYYARSGSGPNYLMDHSVVTYLMSPKGELVAVLRPDQTPQEMAGQILAKMAGRG